MAQHNAQSQPRQRLQRRICNLAPATDLPQLTILTFNILADGLCQEGGFIRAPREALHWEHRRALLLAEITAADADIVCLQECNHFEDFFQPELARLGYEGRFLAKLHSPAQQYGYPADGSALFYRTSRLTAVRPPKGVSFRNADGEAAAQGLLSWRLLDEHAGRELLVATFHLKAKAGSTNDAIRKHQAQQAVAFLAAAASGESTIDSTSNGVSAPATGIGAAAHRIIGSNGSLAALAETTVVGSYQSGYGSQPHGDAGSADARVPVLLAGDMNDVPHSAACQVLRQHSLGLASLWDCQLAVAGDEQELLTTWKFREDGEKRRTIDYIWHTSELQPVARWLTPTAEEIGPDGLPSLHYPSDHLACLARLQWT